LPIQGERKKLSREERKLVPSSRQPLYTWLRRLRPENIPPKLFTANTCDVFAFLHPDWHRSVQMRMAYTAKQLDIYPESNDVDMFTRVNIVQYYELDEDSGTTQPRRTACTPRRPEHKNPRAQSLCSPFDVVSHIRQ
jgi:hypothetical protein